MTLDDKHGEIKSFTFVLDTIIMQYQITLKKKNFLHRFNLNFAMISEIMKSKIISAPLIILKVVFLLILEETMNQYLRFGH